MEKEKTATEIMEEVKADMCNNYCKYPQLYADGGYGCDELIDKQCSNCPLNRL